VYNPAVAHTDSTGASYSSYYTDVKSEFYKLFRKYETKFGAARSQRVPQPSAHSCKKKQSWANIFGEHAGSGGVGPPPVSSSSSSSGDDSELSAYLDSDCVTAYDDDFDLLL
jgi:hypothetical protein